MCEGYDNGLTELAFARFKNENIGNGYSGDAYYIAPAMQVKLIDIIYKNYFKSF